MPASRAQQNAEKVLAHGRGRTDVTANAQIECSEAAGAKIVETSRRIVSLLAEAGGNSRAGTGNAVTLLGTAMGKVSAGCGQC